jgi:hypothetical protein
MPLGFPVDHCSAMPFGVSVVEYVVRGSTRRGSVMHERRSVLREVFFFSTWEGLTRSLTALPCASVSFLLSLKKPSSCSAPPCRSVPVAMPNEK